MKTSTRDRLIGATLGLYTDGQIPTLESAAEAAGVSRATAYRAFSGMADLQSAVLAAYAAQLVDDVMASTAEMDDALAAMETVAVMTVAALQQDATLRALLPPDGLAADEVIRGMALRVIRPILTGGQERGQVRTDLDVSEMIEWLMDSYVSALAYRNMSENEARSMYRKFYVPALRSPSAAQPVELNQAVAHHLKAALALLNETPVNGRKRR